jgi:DNA-binding protein YbaB
VNNDAARHELEETLELVHEHLADLAVVERKRAALSATATAADGTVEVTVDARGIVSATTVDDSYLDDFEMADLGDFVTAAAQEAAGEVGRQSAELLAPLADRRARFPSLSDIVDGAPDLRELMSHLHPFDRTQHSVDDGAAPGDYPTVRS